VGKREAGSVHVEDEEANLDSVVGNKDRRLRIPTNRSKNCRSERMRVSWFQCVDEPCSQGSDAVGRLRRLGNGWLAKEPYSVQPE